MRKALTVISLAAALVAVAVSCSKGPKVIPRRDMEMIYRDMFLADEWLNESGKKSAADTTWFYEPIFEKYGYTVEDYRASVDYYLSDPKRYAEMLGRVGEGLEHEAIAIRREIERQQKLKYRADSIALALMRFSVKDFPIYSDLFLVDSMTDTIDIRLNPKGVYFPVPVVEDTVFHGPMLIVKDTAAVATETPEPEKKPIPWRE